MNATDDRIEVVKGRHETAADRPAEHGFPIGELVTVRYTVAVGLQASGTIDTCPRWMANAMARQGRCVILDDGEPERTTAPRSERTDSPKGRR